MAGADGSAAGSSGTAGHNSGGADQGEAGESGDAGTGRIYVAVQHPHTGDDGLLEAHEAAFGETLAGDEKSWTTARG